MVLLSLFRKDKNGSHSGSRFLGSLLNIGVIHYDWMYFFIAENSGDGRVRLFSDFFSRHTIGNSQEDDGADEVP